MENVTIDGLTFKPFLKENEILERTRLISIEIAKKFKDQNPVFLCVLNGSFFFTAELLKHFKFDYEIAFVRVKSYDGLSSSNEIKEFIGLDFEINDRPIVILEDIVESGLTTNYLIRKMESERPKSISIATLLYKPNKMKYKNLPIDYVGFEITDEFVIGFGLDYNGQARGLREIYQKIED